MNNAFFEVPMPINEPILNYTPGSKEKKELLDTIKEFKSKPIDIPMYINGEEIKTNNKIKITAPHNHKLILGHFNEGDESHVVKAIDSAMNAKKEWAEMSWQNRASIFLKAADLIAGPYRAKINASTMLGQSKNVFQAEVDAACEFIDFLKFNASYMEDIYKNQPESSDGMWNRLDYRPLEGFIFAISPFNFTSIAGNLCASAALMGNTIIWKPAYPQIYSANIIMEIFKDAGLPDGVINLIYVDGPVAGDIIFKHKDFGGLHFTGSTAVFKHLWKEIGNNIDKYKSYPRVVGETGGKDYIIAHKSADPLEVSTAIIRGCFEFQGQKCSAPSRVYIPNNLWSEIKKNLLKDIKSIKMGDPEDFTNFVNAVIEEKAFDKITSYIEDGKRDKDLELLIGGNHDKTKGYFIEPTVFISKDPKNKLMVEEIFGPVTTIYIYDENDYINTLKLVDETSPYALTGAIFAKKQKAINLATKILEYSAGNFYINDKPTGAVVGQQPFGGGRASGTNDKAGSYLNLLRWVSPRTIKEVYNTPKNYKYPFMNEE
jgi:1-pyrroline-5-carboxylate dehydrogenase|tara:strand:+ start:13999 stop:15630 length:1632 start_codon:yes stop_codon:yes gene_type:complete